MNYERAEKKARELVAQMTVEEKISQLLYTSPAIDRLGIKEYNWWNEASHGVARSGMATVFPHAIALAATFDPELLHEVGDAVSTEGRAKYNNSVKHGDFDIYKGLTYWTPNINIFRDQKWGRGQETFGEDPFLTSVMAENYIGGIQGDGEFLKAAACAKHYAVHSGPEPLRHTFDAVVSEHDLWETYLPAFKKCVEAGVAGVMGAYNSTDGVPCCMNERLIADILRGQWGFKGYFVSDCGAINDIYAFHKHTKTITEAAAGALKAGCNLNCGSTYNHLKEAYEEKLIDDNDLTEAAVRVYTIRALLGEFEEVRPYSDIPFSKLDCAEYKALNLKAAEEAVVLLKNDGILPLDRNTDATIAVIGPNAMSQVALEGNYNGMTSEYITPADGIRRVFTNASVRAAKGANIWVERNNDCGGFMNMISEGIAYAEESDVTILCLGLDCSVEGEENGQRNEFFADGDKVSMRLPETQMKLAREVCAVCDNVIILVMAGSAIDLGDEITSKAKAVLHAWYPGAVGGLAAANIIAGVTNPSGRLPVTFISDENNIPEFTNYDMAGRTYRYMNEEPRFPFGFGLSYTKFDYSDVVIECSDDKITLKVSVSNTGSADGAEKVQVYAKYSDSRTVTPNCQLCGVKKVFVRAGETETAEIEIDRFWVKAVLDDGSRAEPDGSIELYIGGHQPDELSNKLTGYECIKTIIK